jgi:3-methyladenine DNA glycosylase AlkC
MTEAFKNLINAQVVRDVGSHLKRVWPAFPRKAFEAQALHGLDALEFKARAQHLAKALAATLPADFSQAADVLEGSLKTLPPPLHSDDPDKALGGMGTDDTGLGGWALWAFGEFVAQHGLAHPERALQTLHAITQRFTAEFAIRPFIVAHPDRVFATLQQWQHDPSAHVRRLVSEGSRPRLPWGLRLHTLVADPSPALPLLRTLQDDPSEYVRRSVANHLNDIAKDHPELIVSWLAEHLPDAPPERVKLLRHASRSLIKAGHPDTMQAWGLGEPFRGRVRLTLATHTVPMGGTLPFEVQLHAAPGPAQTLELDYRVHHVKANGQTSPKTFKGKRLTLQASAPLHWVKQHSFKPISTRRYHPGRHLIELLLNGQTVASDEFTLTG